MATFDKAIPPGQEGSITLRMDTRNAGGSFSKSANVFSNDPNSPMAQIELRAHVKQYIRVSPGYRVMLEGFYGDKAVATINISSVIPEPLKITEVTSDIDEAIKYKLTTIQKDKEYALEINAGSGITRQTQGRVSIKTNYAKRPQIEILVTTSLKSEISFAPRYLYYGIIDTSKETADPTSLVRSAVFENTKGRPFTIERIKAPDWATTSIESDPKSTKQTITIKLNKNRLQKGEIKDKVIVHIRCNERQEAPVILIAGKVI